MNKILIIIIIFLSSCSSSPIRKDYNFSDEMNFDQFRIMLEEYAKNNPYPKVDG